MSGDAGVSAPATLSVALVTGAPARRVAIAIAGLRELADEVVLLIDDRSPARQRAALEHLADRSQTVTFVSVEAHLQELHELTSSEWVIRLAGDEAPSAALLRRLPSLLLDTRFEQWAIRRRWLFPDLGHWIDEVPWAPDFQLRLLRRGAHAFTGRVREGVREVPPVGYVDEPIYHLDCVIATQEERQIKALLYDVRRPEARIAGDRPMHVIYEPERYATRPPAAVPDEDAEVLRTWLCGESAAR